MPGITAGASPTPQHGGKRGWWGQARPMGAVSHRPHARALGQTPQKPPGQIPCQHGPPTSLEKLKYGNQWRSRRSFLGTGRMEVFDAELWAIGLALDVAIETRETLQKHGVKTVAVFSDSQAAIRRTAHLEPGPGQRLARRINRRARNLLAHGVATEIHWVPGHSGIPGNEEADRQANLARDASGSTVIERPYTSASNRAR